MRNIRLMIASALAFACAISLAACPAEAGEPVRHLGKAHGKITMHGQPHRVHNVQGVGPGSRGRHTVQGFIPARQHGSAHYGAVGGYGFGGYGGYYGNYGFGGYGLGYGLPYATSRIPTPPYFSIHPPVYYSQPVARTYGYSPFAYPGTVPTPEVSAVPGASVTIENPYVEQTKAVDSKEEGEPTPANDDDFANAEPQPQTIVNPYVDHPSQFPPAFDMEVTALGD